MTSKWVRVATTGLLLSAGAGYVIRATRSPLRAPIEKFDMKPVPGYKFTCPKDWVCPDLEHPRNWRPLDEPVHKTQEVRT